MAKDNFKVVRVLSEDAAALEAIAWYIDAANVAGALSFVLNRAKLSDGFEAFVAAAQETYEAHKAAAADRMTNIPDYDETQAQY